jgi:hypothetical protein
VERERERERERENDEARTGKVLSNSSLLTDQFSGPNAPSIEIVVGI